MPDLLQPYTVLLITATALSATMAVTALRMRPTLGTRSFAILMSAVALWAFTAFFEFIAYDFATKAFSYGLKYLFVAVVPVAWFSFGLYYANRLRSLSSKQILFLMVIPGITIALVATNPMHHLMFTSFRVHTFEGGRLLFSDFGPWFWIHAAYSYLLLMIGFFYLVKSLGDSSGPYRRQLVALLVGGLTPWLCNMLFILKRQPFPFLDLTPFAFSISGLAFLWGIMRHRLLDIVPIAREVVIHNIEEGIVVTDDEQRILDANPKAAELFAMAPADMIGRKAYRIADWWPLSRSTRGAVPNGWGDVLALTVSGHARSIDISVSELGGSGEAKGSLVILRDITERKKIEKVLRHSEKRFRSFSENAPMVIFELNDKGRITYTNPAWMATMGHDRQACHGQMLADLMEEEQGPAFDTLFTELVQGDLSIAEINLRLQDNAGHKRLFNTIMARNTTNEGTVSGVIGMAKDITEEQKLQEQLLMARKMEAIGTLASGIAHDFNNLLMGIQANISLLWMESNESGALREKLLRIEEQIKTGAGLTRQLLGYARKGRFQVSAIDLRDVIIEAINVIKHTSKNIMIEEQLDDRPLVVNADRGQIELVLLNLLVNAVDVMPGGGHISLACRLIDNEVVAHHWPDLSPGRYIKLAVTDTGVGMDPHTCERIFEPFFTTKDVGRGTGLGLASVYGVVHSYSGRIRVDSQLGRGSTFTIVIPASNGTPPPTTKAGEAPLPSRRQSGTLLVVEDEEAILELSLEMIQSLGFNSLSASSGEEAVRLYRQYQESIDLVLLDIIMPGMDGWTVLHELQKINAQVKVIIASGYNIPARKKHVLADNSHVTLQKPYTRSALAHAIAEILPPAAP